MQKQDRRLQQALKYAQQLKAAGADWVQAHNALYSLSGEISKLFPRAADKTAFLKTPEAAQVSAILESLP